jgi:hypothetical protein
MHAKFEAEGNLDSTKRPRCPKHLFLEAKAFMHVTKKGNAFFI